VKEHAIPFRFALLSLLLLSTLGAFEARLKRGIEGQAPYAVLHLYDKDPFACTVFYDETSRPTLYRCRFKKRPALLPKRTRSDFFLLDFKMEGKVFVVEVEPLRQSAIFPVPPAVQEDPVLLAQQGQKSRHWTVLGYEGKVPPYLGARPSRAEGLSFPIDLSRYKTPAVGAVDINGEPVFLENHRDIERLIRIKEAFKAGRYAKTYEAATEAYNRYKNSIFASDFLRYRIKALVEEGMKDHADEIIQLGKYFIKHYASDEYLPEVLLLLARVYSATGFVSDANYFYDRLIHEHEGNRFANLGLIYLGDELYMNGKVKEAMQSYLDALYSAKELDVASLAAYKLVLRYMEQGETDKAVTFLKKLWEKNPDYLLKNPDDTFRLAEQLAGRERVDLAIAVTEGLLKKMNPQSDLYEKALYELAGWYDEKGSIRGAIQWYERYLKEFPYGDYSDKVKEKLDALFVVSNDVNTTAALKRYDALIKTYGDGPIAEKALVAKMRLLLEMNATQKVLTFADKVAAMKEQESRKKGEALLREAARKVFEAAKKSGDCKKALQVLTRYALKPKREDDSFVYACRMRFAQYDKALTMAKRALQSDDPKARALWTCRAMKALAGLERWREALEAADDLVALSDKPQTLCPAYPWVRAKALAGAGRYAALMTQLHAMAKAFGDDMRLADLYRRAYTLAKKEGDDASRRWLLEQLIALQNRAKSHPYSPWAEFELIGLLKQAGNVKEALVLMQKSPLKLTGVHEARWLYEKALLEARLGQGKKAKADYKACAKVQNGGDWANLCKQSLTLQ